MSTSLYPGAAVRDATVAAKTALSSAIVNLFKAKFDLDFSVDEVVKLLSRPKSADHGDFALPSHFFMRTMKANAAAIKEQHGFDVNPNAIAEFIAAGLNALPITEGLSVAGASALKTVATTGAFVNVTFTPAFHAQLLWSTVLGDYIAPLKVPGMDKVMIEYSQPNTHKAFHVGHMRNAALGDSLVRLYEQAGHEVVAVNYFGDEGAHVAKCLWYLQKIYLPKAQAAAAAGKTFNPEDPTSVYPFNSLDELESAIPVAARAEWLGDLYTKAVDLLDLSTYTTLPWSVVIAAKVVAKGPHPDPEAPANWHLNTVQVDEKGTTAQVVCGGTGYEVGDYVAYLPVGAKLTKKMGVIAPKDMRGVMSCGVMLAESELGGGDDEEDAPAPEGDASAAKPAKGGKAKKGATADAAAVAAKQIKLLDATTAKAGVPLCELGRKDTVPEGKTVVEYFNSLKAQAAEVLIALEHNVPDQVALWRRTGQWSLDAFHEIYKWLDCRFDHDFTESEVSEPSRKIMTEWLAQGKLTHKDGAVVCDLTADNLGYCVLLKSDGAGLYATKDIALASRKFEQFNIDKSIYVVDSAQSFHFAQVFKVLERCGYEQAKKCLHISYGQVVLPSGRMSSRKGNVLLFSELRSTIEKVLNEKYNTSGTLTAEAIRRVAVASIKYGMLNHDTAKNIVFEMDKWTNNTGNTGPYLMYAFARINSILGARKAYDGPKFDFIRSLIAFTQTAGVPVTEEELFAKFVDPETLRFDFPAFAETEAGKAFTAAVDFNSYLTESSERLVLLHMGRFWEVIEAATASNNPSPVCDFGFGLAQAFSTWYEQVRLTQVKPEAVPTKVIYIKAIAQMLERVLYVLGITSIERM